MRRFVFGPACVAPRGVDAHGERQPAACAAPASSSLCRADHPKHCRLGHSDPSPLRSGGDGFPVCCRHTNQGETKNRPTSKRLGNWVSSCWKELAGNCTSYRCPRFLQRTDAPSFEKRMSFRFSEVDARWCLHVQPSSFIRLRSVSLFPLVSPVSTATVSTYPAERGRAKNSLRDFSAC